MTDLVLYHSMEDGGAATNQMASENIFADFQSRKAKNSLLRQKRLGCVSNLPAIGGGISG